jgi:hypothetical protein
MKNDIETTEVTPGHFESSPFPMSLETQKRLLELIYNRKSGIITRIESTINEIQAKLKKLDKIADENDALWKMLDEQREMDQIFVQSAEEYNKEIAEILLRNAKVQGDA